MRRKRQRLLVLERLEPRDMPATLVSPTTVTYQDIDADIVTVRLSKPLLTAANVANIFQFDHDFGNSGSQLLKVIDLQSLAAVASGLSLTHSAVSKLAGGDGVAAVGIVNADGIDLGSVVIDGDLGEIIAGDANDKTPGLKSLHAKSMGELNVSTQQAGLISSIAGKLGKLRIDGNVNQASITAHGAHGDIGTVTIQGSLLGGTDLLGSITAEGNLGTVKIQGNVSGGLDENSGFIQATGKIAKVTVIGNLDDGQSDLHGGVISAGSTLGAVNIGGNVEGGLLDGGRIVSGGALASVTIGGFLFGKAAASGQISSGASLGPVKITGDVIGGLGKDSGKISAVGPIQSVTIGGSLLGGFESGTGVINTPASLGTVKITGSVTGHSPNSGLVVSTGALKSVSIGGDLLGQADSSGDILAGSIGAVVVTGDVRGELGKLSGAVVATSGGIRSVNIGGNLAAGSGQLSGLISSKESVGSIRIAKDISGGSDLSAGGIFVTGNLSSLRINGSLLGGAGTSSGIIAVSGTLAKAMIDGAVVGHDATGSADLEFSGSVLAQRIGTLKLGSLISGQNQTTGQYVANGSILAEDDIGSLTIGQIIGNSTHAALISARGQAVSHRSDVAIGKLTVTGSVAFAQIQAGFDSLGHAVNGDAQIGPVKVGGDWQASNLVAGATAGLNGQFGDDDDVPIFSGKPNILSRLSSVTIGGTITGTAADGDSFGFVAQSIGVFKVGKQTKSTTNGLDIIPLATDVTLREV